MAANDPRKAQDVPEGIPMSKTNPMLIIGIAGAVVLILGVIGFKALSSSKDKKVNQEAAAAAAAAGQPDDGMTAAERKKHLEITRKSLAKWSKDEAGREAQKKAAAEEAKRKAEEEERAKTAKAAPKGGGGGARKPSAKATKAQSSALDDIAGDITGKLK